MSLLNALPKSLVTAVNRSAGQGLPHQKKDPVREEKYAISYRTIQRLPMLLQKTLLLKWMPVISSESSIMDAPPFCLSLIVMWIHTKHCMNVLHLLLIVSAW
jgi:hypothetical protein